MPAHKQNQKDLAAVEKAIEELRSNANQGDLDAANGILRLCKDLDVQVEYLKRNVQGIA